MLLRAVPTSEGYRIWELRGVHWQLLPSMKFRQVQVHTVEVRVQDLIVSQVQASRSFLLSGYQMRQ
jgi:hypothetical protein